MEKGIKFSPLWPLWPLWCLCVASVEKRHCVPSSMKIRFFLVSGMYTVPFFYRSDTEEPQRPQRPQRRKRDAFFQRGHRGAAFFLLMAGHLGRAITLELIVRKYYWPTMRKEVDQFVRNCHTCTRAKTQRQVPAGTLKSLPIPAKPWEDVSMDFVTGLPESEGYNAILVIVDLLTKM